MKENKKKVISLAALILAGALTFSTGCNKKTNDNKESNSNVESNVTSNSNEEDNKITPAEKTTMTNKFYNLIGAKKTKDIIKGFVVDEGFLDYSKYVFNKNDKDYEKNAVSAILRTTTLAEITVDKSKLNSDIKFVDEKKGIITGIKVDFFKKNYKNVFGKDVNESAYKGKDAEDDFLDCTIGYQRNLNLFATVNGACGGAGYTSNVFYLENVVKENGDIIVKTYVGTHVSNTDGEYYYKDADYVYNGNYKKEDIVEAISEKTKEKYTLYNFIFKKSSDGNYYFDSVKKA